MTTTFRLVSRMRLSACPHPTSENDHTLTYIPQMTTFPITNDMH